MFVSSPDGKTLSCCGVNVGAVSVAKVSAVGAVSVYSKFQKYVKKFKNLIFGQKIILNFEKLRAFDRYFDTFRHFNATF